MQKKLELSLSLVIDWLKFAEGKNASLVAANGAAIFGIISLIGSTTATNEILLMYFYQALFFLVLSAVSCLISFIPQVHMTEQGSNGDKKNKDNLLSYADIAKYSPEHYLRLMYKQEDVELQEINSFELSLSELTVSYSQIALRKYTLFNIGVWSSLSAIVTPLLALAIYIFRK